MTSIDDILLALDDPRVQAKIKDIVAPDPDVVTVLRAASRKIQRDTIRAIREARQKGLLDLKRT